MQGVTHKAIGTIVGASMVVYAVKSNQPMFALGAITAPMGAMLPDIDHDRSKLGSKRKLMAATINNLIGVIFVAAILLMLVTGVKYGAEALVLFREVLITALICGICLIANSEKMKKKFKFLHKHRGIMHTLLIPVLLAVCVSAISIEWLSCLILGLALGYLSHLYADCLTVSGCPIAWPISEECFRMARIRTATSWEYFGAVCLSLCIFGTGFVANSEDIRLLWIWALPLALAVGSMTASRVLELFPKLKKKKVLLFFVSLAFAACICIYTSKIEIRVMIGVAFISYILKIFKLCRSKKKKR